MLCEEFRIIKDIERNLRYFNKVLLTVKVTGINQDGYKIPDITHKYNWKIIPSVINMSMCKAHFDILKRNNDIWQIFCASWNLTNYIILYICISVLTNQMDHYVDLPYLVEGYYHNLQLTSTHLTFTKPMKLWRWWWRTCAENPEKDGSFQYLLFLNHSETWHLFPHSV